MLVKQLNSLQTKLIASFVLLILIIAGGTFFYTYNETKQAMLDLSKDEMLQVIGMISQQFSTNEITKMLQLQPGQENTAEYLTLQTKMQTIRILSPDIINIYTMYINEGEVIFLVDDAQDEPALIGDVYDAPDQRLFDAINGVSVSDSMYTDMYGTFLSAYAPLKDENGNVAVVIGADMAATKVIERQNFIGNTIYFIIGIAILIAAIIMGWFSMTIIRDIKKLNITAEEISKGNTSVTIDVKRKDEIGELAESFSRMVASLKFMMSEKQENDKA